MKIKCKHVILVILSVFICNVFIYVFNWMLSKTMGIFNPFWITLSFSVMVAIVPMIFIFAFYLVDHNLNDVWFEIIVEKKSPFEEEDD